MKNVIIKIYDESNIFLKEYEVKTRGFKTAVDIVSKLYRKSFLIVVF